uniref:SAM domain-containing protein n=1 Tax=Takifugu rubripes TaxID=31033 RepID=A0A674MXE4_TAKRU
MEHQPTERATFKTRGHPEIQRYNEDTQLDSLLMIMLKCVWFFSTFPGCSDVAEAFRLQEIDGQALLLLTEDHLMTSMNIKLGPALKICAHINSLKNQ